MSRARQKCAARIGASIHPGDALAILVLLTAVAGHDASLAASPYETPVSIPDCVDDDESRASLPGVKIIDSLADWDDVNDPAFGVFCVAPGDYSLDASGQPVKPLVLTASGTPSKPRVVRYYVPGDQNDDTHPTDQPESDRAIVRGLHFIDADHWIVQGITSRGGSARWIGAGFNWGFPQTRCREQGNTNDRNILLGVGTESLVLDRLLIERGCSSLVKITHEARDNTLQNSVIRTTDVVSHFDRGCVTIGGENSTGNAVVHNEIYDCAGDGISLGFNDTASFDHSGTLIADNDIYLGDDLSSDGTGSQRDPGPLGEMACAENAIDIKTAVPCDVPSATSPACGQVSATGDDVVRILGNRIWGFRLTDPACGGSGSAGDAIGLHNENANFLLIQDNIIWDVPRAVSFGRTGGEASHVSIVSNLFSDFSTVAVKASAANRTEMYRNTIITGDLHATTGLIGGRVECSNVRGAGIAYLSESVCEVDPGHDDNAPFDTGFPICPTLGAAEDEALLLAGSRHCFTKRIWTNPTTHCIDFAPTETRIDLNEGPGFQVSLDCSTTAEAATEAGVPDCPAPCAEPGVRESRAPTSFLDGRALPD